MEEILKEEKAKNIQKKPYKRRKKIKHSLTIPFSILTFRCAVFHFCNSNWRNKYFIWITFQQPLFQYWKLIFYEINANICVQKIHLKFFPFLQNRLISTFVHKIIRKLRKTSFQIFPSIFLRKKNYCWANFFYIKIGIINVKFFRNSYSLTISTCEYFCANHIYTSVYIKVYTYIFTIVNKKGGLDPPYNF